MPEDTAAEFKFIVAGRATVTEEASGLSRAEWHVEVLKADEGAAGSPIPYDENWPNTEMRRIGSPRMPLELESRRMLTLHRELVRLAPLFIVEEVMNLLSDIDELFHTGKYAKTDTEGTIDFHLERTRESLLDMFGLAAPKTGKRNGRGRWTKAELQKAVRDVLKPLPPDERRWARAAEELKRREPERAPATGEALRKLCERLGVDTSKFIRQGGKRTPKLPPLEAEQADIS